MINGGLGFTHATLAIFFRASLYRDFQQVWTSFNQNAMAHF